VTIRIETGDCLDVLRNLPPCFRVNCCVTSPPYFGLRDYGHAGQIGLEPTPDEYVAKLVDVFRDVRRVLADDGTLWLNLGDSYAGRGATGGMDSLTKEYSAVAKQGFIPPAPGFKNKDMYGIPWRVAFALQADGWYLRSDIIWHKPNPMPESVTDRPTKAHEYIFLLAKSRTYYYDAAAIAEPSTGLPSGNVSTGKYDMDDPRNRTKAGLVGYANKMRERKGCPNDAGDATRNRRTVWTVVTQPYSGAHFATFPPDLIEPCIKAGCPVGGTVLDPFGGAGTTGLVADRLQRNALLIELNPEYAEMARDRIHNDAPLFSAVDDGFGNQWAKCGPDCAMQIVRPGKVQCDCNRASE
jgi:DNA modification methylase